MVMARSDPQINIRVPAAIKKQLEIDAIQNGRSLNAEVVLRLENSLQSKQGDKELLNGNPHTIEAYIKHVVGLMKTAKDWGDFQEQLNNPYPPKKSNQ